MIFYLSGTGNTLWVATLLASATGERLINIADEVGGKCRYQLMEGETIGFCFPIHGWRPPLMVRSFMQQLHIDSPQKPYCWTVVTAGTDVGIAVDYLKADLLKVDLQIFDSPRGNKGIEASFVASIIMPNTYVGLPLMDVDAVSVSEQKKQTAKTRIKNLTNRILKRETSVDVFPGSLPWLKSKVLGGAFVRWLITDKPFRVNDNCQRCGVCKHVCPVKNILWEKGELPTWKHNGNCLTCFACYHHCPTHAIDFAGQTKRKGQYFFKKT